MDQHVGDFRIAQGTDRFGVDQYFGIGRALSRYFEGLRVLVLDVVTYP